MKIILPKEQLYKYYIEENKSSTEIAKIFNCSQNTILRNFKLHNIPVRKFTNYTRKLRKPINKDLLEQLYIKEGKTTVEISKVIYAPISTVWYQLKKYEFKLRHPGSKGNETKIKKEDLYELYVKQLKTQEEIGKFYNCSAATIKKYLEIFKLYKKGEYRPNFPVRGENHSTKRLEVRRKMSENHADVSGDKNPNWNNGTSREGYSYKFNKQLKEQIRKRDNYICQNCSITEEEYIIVFGRTLDVHHIDYNKENCQESNLITLCQSCNSRVNYNRDYWFAYFTYIMED